MTHISEASNLPKKSIQKTHISETGLLNHIAVAFDRLKLVASLGNIVFELLAVLLARLVRLVFFSLGFPTLSPWQ